MKSRALLSTGQLIAGLLFVMFLSVVGLGKAVNDYSQKSVVELIDELTQIDSQSPGVNSAAVYEGFIADNSPGSFQVGVLGIAPTKLEVGNRPSGKQVGVDAFMFTYFSDEYDTRIPHWFREEDWKKGPRPME